MRQAWSEQLELNPDCAASALLRKPPAYDSLPNWAPKPLVTLGFLYYCNAAQFREHLVGWSAWPMQLRSQSFFASRPLAKASTCMRISRNLRTIRWPPNSSGKRAHIRYIS